MADPAAILARNKRYVKPGAGNFATTLPPDQEQSFGAWVRENNVPFDPKATGPQDYDMRGFYKGLQSGDPKAKSAIDPNDQKLHYPDYWKTPYHETFSNESQWATPDAPKWNAQDQLVASDGTVVFDDRAQSHGPLVNPDDVSAPYLDYRKQSSTDDLIARARARIAPATQAPAVQTPAGNVVTEPQATAQPEEPQTAFDAAVAPKPRLGPAPAPAKDISPIPAIKDVAKGITTEIPRAIVRGGLDAASGLLSAGGELLNWSEKAFAKGINSGLKTQGIATSDPDAAPDTIPPEWIEAVKDAPNAVDRPKTVTGNLISGAVQFISVMKTAATALEAAKVAPTLANTLGGGISMATAFQGSEGTLAELVQSNPKLANPITEFLASKPGDNEAVQRLKNGVEGVFGGFIADGFVRSLKFFKEARAPVTQEGATAAPSQIELPSLAPERDFMLLGDPKAPLLSVKPKPGTQGPVAKIGAAMEATGGVDQGAAASGLAKDAAKVGTDFGNKTVDINWSRINSADDVKLVLGQMTEAFSGDIAKAQRGVRSNELTQQVADSLGMTPEDVLRRRAGQPFNAEEALAARNLMVASGAKLLEAAQKAAAPGATAADQFVFRKMMATHYAIQAEVIGARTETARALQSWSIPAAGGQEQMKALEQLLTATGGTDVSQAMAKRLAMLAESGADPAALNAAVRKGAFATTLDAVREVWINGLLWSPTTHIVNTASNFNVAMQQIFERGVAGQIAKATGSGGVAEGEATAMMYGLLNGAKDMMRSVGKRFMEDESTFLKKGEVPGGDVSKMDITREPAFSSQAFNLDEAGGAGRAVDFLGSVFRLPGSALAAQDALFKSIGYRMELHAQAYRQASSEGLQGRALGTRVAEIVQNPPENIRLASADAALYNTFQQAPGEWGKSILNARTKIVPLQFILPFVRTPVNIARYSFERTPIAPLVGQWRADIAAGGARKDLALARMATGSVAMSIAADFAQQGIVSGQGPKEPGQRNTLLRTGWQPYSVKIGDKWYSYNRTDPFGQTLGAAADLTEALSAGDVDPGDAPEWDKIAAGIAASASQFTINKTYLRGVADFTNFMTDYQRYGQSYTDNFVSSFLPFNTGLATAERIVDPTNRMAQTPMESMLAKIPGLSKRLTAKMDLWGEPINANPVGGATFAALSPIRVTKADASPIDAEMLRLSAFVAPIAKKTSFQGVPVDFREFPKVYEAYVKLAGNAMKSPIWGLGAKDFLSQTVEGKGPMGQIYKSGVYTDGPDGSKADFIKQTVQQYRREAQDAILRDPQFSDFANYVTTQQKAQMQLNMPGQGEEQ